MKIILLFAIFVLSATEGFTWSPAELRGTNISRISIKNLPAMTLPLLLNLTPSEYKLLTGRKMTFKQKITFSILKARLQKRAGETVSKKSNSGTIALILGIFALVSMLAAVGALGILGVFAAIGALVMGIKGLKEDKKDLKALIGVIIGGGFLVLLAIVVLVFITGGIH